MGQLDGARAAVSAWKNSIVVFALALLSMAHVGSPDTFFTGVAGPYPVRVTVRLPGVIPGLAQISVRIPGSSPGEIRRVTVRAIQWNLGPEGAPPADVATAVPGDPELHAADLWLMVATSYRVVVTVEGQAGSGAATVPVMALATAQREMPRGLGFVLAGLGIFLGVGLLTIVGAAVRESVVPPGETPDPARRRRARITVAIMTALLILAVVGGRAWWNSEAAAYAQSVLFRPFANDVTTRENGASRILTLTIRDSRWPPQGNAVTRYNALMPDHGKLMHMFLVREDLAGFAHLHPVPRSTSAETFDVVLPALPSGRYRVYGDIVHESGYAQTLVGSVALGNPLGTSTDADADDSWFLGQAPPEDATATSAATEGMTITWKRGDPIVAGRERVLTFVATNADGAPAALEPYMGMLGHAAVTNTDGSVFAHLHPAGSISMAALRKFQGADPHAEHGVSSGKNEVSIPYAFPKPGRYRLWIQMKRAGQVTTGAFDLDVKPAE